MNNNQDFYSLHAVALADDYERVSFPDVHSSWYDIAPKEGSALDIGAGSGRDAAFLASTGLKVTAVEPSEGMRHLAKERHQNASIEWTADSLPSLRNVVGLNRQFDLILLSAVWMHIHPSDRLASLQVLADLIKSSGLIVLTLRHGLFTDNRSAFSVSFEEVSTLARDVGLTTELLADNSEDKLGRAKVTWQTVILRKDTSGNA
ncbi:class I SAM-dependent methyltransferase [Alteromonas sp. H39]|uniref:class I SAM-dependent methyltransferase n=1 Tax=Alteromonas sp. H39 TaxID=3389876 RepID=UPI0039E1BDF0